MSYFETPEFVLLSLPCYLHVAKVKPFSLNYHVSLAHELLGTKGKTITDLPCSQNIC